MNDFREKGVFTMASTGYKNMSPDRQPSQESGHPWQMNLNYTTAFNDSTGKSSITFTIFWRNWFFFLFFSLSFMIFPRFI